MDTTENIKCEIRKTSRPQPSVLSEERERGVKCKGWENCDSVHEGEQRVSRGICGWGEKERKYRRKGFKLWSVD